MRTPADLRKTFVALDHLFLDGRCVREGVKIRWKRFRNAKTSFTFAVYYMDEKEIHVNYRLAQDDVPNYVVASCVWHEMCHHTHGYDHTAAFHKAEAEFVRHWDSEIWCEQFVLAHTVVDDSV